MTGQEGSEVVMEGVKPFPKPRWIIWYQSLSRYQLIAIAISAPLVFFAIYKIYCYRRCRKAEKVKCLLYQEHTINATMRRVVQQWRRNITHHLLFDQSIRLEIIELTRDRRQHTEVATLPVIFPYPYVSRPEHDIRNATNVFTDQVRPPNGVPCILAMCYPSSMTDRPAPSCCQAARDLSAHQGWFVLDVPFTERDRSMAIHNIKQSVNILADILRKSWNNI